MEKLQSFLGDSSKLSGDLYSSGILRLDGIVVGTIRAEEVILSETASIEGEIAAGKIIVVGKVKGTLKAEDVVEIRAKGYVNGNIVTKRLVMLSGGKFNGRIEMTR
ncbi:MAG: polymer-forming cytoskeletal protein [Acidobacteria bacterium]|nr:polymer-forming cytoskeletal protein [Acidobacteriota bacterium]